MADPIALQFTTKPHACHRRHYVTATDVQVLLSRLPSELYERLRAVHFNDRGLCRRLGYVSKQGRREITLCALPVRVSLSCTVGCQALVRLFGAVRARVWPELAVRRFMLYDVFLHELGHLQVIHPRAKSPRRRFAHERLAQEFAEYWRRRLWSQPFDHADPVHRPPTQDEFVLPAADLRPVEPD